MFTTINVPNRRYLLGLAGTILLILALLLTSTAGRASNRLAAQTDGESNITVLGYGDAQAPADIAQVTLSFGAKQSYGPEAVALEPVDEADVALLVDALGASGIDTKTVDIDLFSNNSFYGPSNETKVSFTYTHPADLNHFFSDLLATLKERKGPVIQSARVIYLLADCATVEKQAWEAALLNAQQRAEQAAALLDAKRGALLRLSEKSSSPYDQTLSGCNTLAAASSASDYQFQPLAGMNSTSTVEISIGVETVYALVK